MNQRNTQNQIPDRYGKIERLGKQYLETKLKEMKEVGEATGAAKYNRLGVIRNDQLLNHTTQGVLRSKQEGDEPRKHPPNYDREHGRCNHSVTQRRRQHGWTVQQKSACAHPYQHHQTTDPVSENRLQSGSRSATIAGE